MVVLRLVLQLCLGIGLSYLVQRLDRDRLTEAQRARAWNSVTWFVALWWFGALSMIPWGFVTRRYWGLVLGCVAALLIMLVQHGADLAFAHAFGLPLEL